MRDRKSYPCIRDSGTSNGRGFAQTILRCYQHRSFIMHPLRFFGLVIIVLLMTALTPFSPMGTPSVRIAHATTRTVSLLGYYSIGWNNTPANPTITITEGDALVITTSSGDTFQHHFFVDIDGLGMTPNCSVDKCASIIPPTATDTLTGFTMGTYTYYCEYHSAMKGTFIVQPPPPPGTSA